MKYIYVIEVYTDCWQVYGLRCTEEDAKALANILYNRITTDASFGFECAMKRVRYRKIKTEKTSELKTARWSFYENKSGDWFDKCSICGGLIVNNNGACCGLPFCPHCGAEMDLTP